MVRIKTMYAASMNTISTRVMMMFSYDGGGQRESAIKGKLEFTCCGAQLRS